MATYRLFDTENCDEFVPLKATNEADARAEARAFFRDLLSKDGGDLSGMLYVVLPGVNPDDYEHADGSYMIHDGIVSQYVRDINVTVPVE
jgi:hypothetical protein